MAVLLLLGNVQASPEDQSTVSHDHNGVLPHYTGEPARVELTEYEQKRLARGKGIIKKRNPDTPGLAITVFPVKASQQHIWSVLRNFDKYPEWIKEVKEVSVYREEPGKHYVKFRSESFLTGKVIWYAVHDFPEIDEVRSWGTWRLDYDYRSDLDDVVGFWRVDESNSDPDINYVTYATRIKPRQSVPGFIANLLNRKGLRGAAKWVTEQAERKAGESVTAITDHDHN